MRLKETTVHVFTIHTLFIVFLVSLSIETAISIVKTPSLFGINVICLITCEDEYTDFASSIS